MIYLRSFAIIIICYTFTLAQTNMPGGITGKISISDTNAINNIGIQIESLPIPEIVYPQNDAVDIPIVPKFVIGTVINANRYEMELSFSQSFFFNVFSRAYWEFEEPLGIDFLEWFPFISDIDDFQNNRTYYWRVRALNTITNEASQWSQIHKYQTISSGESVNQPTLIYPENNSKIPWIDVNFEWTKVNTSKWYQLQWGENGQLTQYRWSDMENPFKKENLKPLTSYFWKVVAFNDNSISEFSNYGYFETRNEIIESGFKLNVDGYSFDNDTTLLSYLASGLDDIYRDYKSELSYILPFLKVLGRILFTGKGNCYGMSASSIMYYHYDYLIPSPYSYTQCPSQNS